MSRGAFGIDAIVQVENRACRELLQGSMYYKGQTQECTPVSAQYLVYKINVADKGIKEDPGLWLATVQAFP